MLFEQNKMHRFNKKASRYFRGQLLETSCNDWTISFFSAPILTRLYVPLFSNKKLLANVTEVEIK